MKRDWIWAWVSGLVSVIALAVLIKNSPLAKGPVGVMLGLTFGLAVTIATLVLWWKNQRSIRTMRRSGREPTLIVRPGGALLRALTLFPVFFTLRVLGTLMLHAAIDWPMTIIWAAGLAYAMALMVTVYRKPTQP